MLHPILAVPPAHPLVLPAPPARRQITHPYHPGLTHRPDVAFAIYGFVPKHDPPLLCAQVGLPCPEPWH